MEEILLARGRSEGSLSGQASEAGAAGFAFIGRVRWGNAPGLSRSFSAPGPPRGLVFVYLLPNRPVSVARRRRRAALSGEKSSARARQAQFPAARPGVFIRALLPRSKTSWIGTTARAAT